MRALLLLSTLLCSTLFGADIYPSAQEGAFYNYHSRQQANVAFTALKKSYFKGDEKILDIGCGSGKVTANLAGRVPQGMVLGVDLGAGMISFAKSNYAPFYPNLKFAQGDALDLKSKDDFDFICSFSSLHWILDQESLLAKVHKALKKGGKILFTIPCAPLPEVAAVFKEVIAQEPWFDLLKSSQSLRRKYTESEYVKLLKEAGFNEINVTAVPFTYHFETKREFAFWFAAFTPLLVALPPAMHEEFLMALTDRYVQTYPVAKDGRLVFKQNELIIQATK